VSVQGVTRPEPAIFVPQHMDVGDGGVQLLAEVGPSASATGASPAGGQDALVQPVEKNCYADQVEKEKAMGDDGKRAEEANREWANLERKVKEWGLGRERVHSDGNCMIGAGRITANKLRWRITHNAGELRHKMVELLRLALDKPTSHRALTLREGLVARGPNIMSVPEQKQWVEDVFQSVDKAFTLSNLHIQHW
jgi:hypothetical protein